MCSLINGHGRVFLCFSSLNCLFWIAHGSGQNNYQWQERTWIIMPWVPAESGNFSLHHSVHTGSGAHPASYPVSTRGSFPGGKAAGEWSWPLTATYCRGQRMCGAIPLIPNTPSWRGAQLKHRDIFTTSGIPTFEWATVVSCHNQKCGCVRLKE
jgi:hypothetical protein